jgi:hypothetical protein
MLHIEVKLGYEGCGTRGCCLATLEEWFYAADFAEAHAKATEMAEAQGCWVHSIQVTYPSYTAPIMFPSA